MDCNQLEHLILRGSASLSRKHENYGEICMPIQKPEFDYCPCYWLSHECPSCKTSLHIPVIAWHSCGNLCFVRNDAIQNPPEKIYNDPFWVIWHLETNRSWSIVCRLHARDPLQCVHRWQGVTTDFHRVSSQSLGILWTPTILETQGHLNKIRSEASPCPWGWVLVHARIAFDHSSEDPSVSFNPDHH